MNDQEKRTLQERIERLENIVDELRRSVNQLAITIPEKAPKASVTSQDKITDRLSSEQSVEAVQSVAEPEIEEELKHCPYCHEMIQKEAVKCRYCRNTLPAPEVNTLEEVPIGEAFAEKERPENVVPPESIEQPVQPSRTSEEWEAFVGGKLLNRIGSLALIIGLGFFLKYAFDNNWINETMRALIGVAAGAALLAGGAHFHKKGLQIFAQGLVGAGIPILYLSVYASFNFYNLVSQTAAFVLMSAVTLIAFQQAMRYDSFAVSLLGWFGGFLTPFLLSTGEVNAVGLFTYIVLLDAGLLAVCFMKESWGILEPLTLFSTYLIYFYWYEEFYEVNNFTVAVVFLTLFWGLFYALDVARIIKSARSFNQLRQAVPAVNTVVYYLLLYVMLDPVYPGLTAPVTLVVGAVYFLTFLWSLQRKSVANDESTLARNVLTSVIFLVIATDIQFSDFTLAIVWMLESLFLVWCGVRFKLKYIWKSALIVCVSAILKLLSLQESWVYVQDGEFSLMLNQRFLAFAVITASIGGITVIMKNLQDKYITYIRPALHYSWCILLCLLCSVETKDFLYDYSELTMLYVLVVVWAVYSLPVVHFGLRQRITPLLACGLGALCLSGVFAVVHGLAGYEPINEFTPLLNLRAISLVLVIGGLLIHSFQLKRHLDVNTWIVPVSGAIQVSVVLLAFVLLTAETSDIFEKAVSLLPQSTDTDTELGRLISLKQLSLSGVWLGYSMFLMAVGMWRRFQGVRIMSIVLFGITILKIFVYDLSFLEQPYRILSFIGLGLILLAVSYVYQRYRDVIFSSEIKKNEIR